MTFDSTYDGSASWQRYITEKFGTPCEVAVWARTDYPDERPAAFCGSLIDDNNGSFADPDSDYIDDQGEDGWHLTTKEKNTLVGTMLKDLRKAGVVTTDGLNDWVPGILENVESDDQDEDQVDDATGEVLPDDREPVAFENTVQRRGSATSIYIPKAVEREAGISAGDRVAVTLLRVSHV